MMKLDEYDRQILDIIQNHFPIVSHPFKKIGDEVGLSEEQVLSRIARMQNEGIIRQISAVFDLNRLGFISTLCAARVDEKELKEFVAYLNTFPEVTHNYLRNHRFNVWFTLIARDKKHLDELLQAIRSRKELLAFLNLPARKVYKIHVEFKIGEKNSL